MGALTADTGGFSDAATGAGATGRGRSSGGLAVGVAGAGVFTGVSEIGLSTDAATGGGDFLLAGGGE